MGKWQEDVINLYDNFWLVNIWIPGEEKVSYFHVSVLFLKKQLKPNLLSVRNPRQTVESRAYSNIFTTTLVLHSTLLAWKKETCALVEYARPRLAQSIANVQKCILEPKMKIKKIINHKWKVHWSKRYINGEWVQLAPKRSATNTPKISSGPNFIELQKITSRISAKQNEDISHKGCVLDGILAGIHVLVSSSTNLGPDTRQSYTIQAHGNTFFFNRRSLQLDRRK